MISTSDSTSEQIPKWQVIAGWVMSCLLLVPFVPSVFMKLAQPGDFLANWTKGYPAGTARPLGLVELGCVVLYFVPKTRMIGAVLMTGYLGGAVATHVHGAEAVWPIPIVVGILAWGGLYLRDLRVRAMMPLVRDE